MDVDFSGQPYFLSSFHNSALPTLSNASVNLTNTMYRNWSLLWTFYVNVCDLRSCQLSYWIGIHSYTQEQLLGWCAGTFCQKTLPAEDRIKGRSNNQFYHSSCRWYGGILPCLLYSLSCIPVYIALQAICYLYTSTLSQIAHFHFHLYLVFPSMDGVTYKNSAACCQVFSQKRSEGSGTVHSLLPELSCGGKNSLASADFSCTGSFGSFFDDYPQQRIICSVLYLSGWNLIFTISVSFIPVFYRHLSSLYKIVCAYLFMKREDQYKNDVEKKFLNFSSTS